MKVREGPLLIFFPIFLIMSIVFSGSCFAIRQSIEVRDWLIIGPMKIDKMLYGARLDLRKPLNLHNS